MRKKRWPRWEAKNREHRTSGSDWIWRPTRMAIYWRDGFACLKCGAQNLALDHVTDEGGNGPDNLITLCNECNASRGVKLLIEYDAHLAARAAIQLAIPIDREKGRLLCEERWPGWLERKLQSSASSRLKKKRPLGKPRKSREVPPEHAAVA
jgi:hypothetical protein